ncbi:AzlD family protein [Microvirga pudoricolor]|uniref:AzlD family protein n=1 Tax=Microvirga pudoricolor TaxID=2778729 RepID=UPI00194E8A2F|nr:AzlD domain-containing protein [Microvirga pudoricolor]MBM6596710.1 AzlD domain-containing protein [Microvirga pudoricolor]
MSDVHSLAAGPWGAAITILIMGIITYLCRIGGVVLMSHIRLTPRAERGLRALPGSIIVATIAPVTVDTGLTAFVSLAVTVIVMALTRKELIGLAAGLGTLSLIRALGF